MLALACLLYVASWPGSVLRERIPEEPVAPPVPAHVVERDGALDVIVRDASGKAIEGARVRAFAMLDGRAHAAAEGTSDQDGRAALDRLPRAAHFVVAEAKGRARASRMVAVVAGARRVDLTLGAEHALDVVVKDEGGAAVANAEVEVRFADPFPVGARTDASGRAHVGKLGEGPFVVTARARGYEDVTRRRVSEGATCTLTLSRQGALRISVLDPSGKHVQNARIFVASATLWPARVAETDANGVVRVGALAPGTYSLRAVHGTLVSETDIGVPVARGEEKEVELRLVPGVTVGARIVDGGTDEGIAHAKVTLTEDGLSSFPIEGVSDGKGHVVLGPIASVSATIEARAEGFVARSARRIDPPPNETTITLVRGGALVGRVVDARGYPIEGATVRVVGTDASGMPIDEDPARASFRDAHFAAALAGPMPFVPANELGVVPGPVPNIPRSPGSGGVAGGVMGVGATTSPPVEPWISGRDGTFRATPVSPGRVRALVHHPQYVEAMSEVVTLASDGEASVTVVLRQGGTLEGRVVDARGRPVENARVTALATHGQLERSERSASDGTFAFASVPESVTLLVARDDDFSQVDARLVVDVPDGRKREVEIVLPDPRAPLDVRITSERGRGIDAAQVTALSVDPNAGLRTTAFTDARGEATLASARGIALRVEVRAPGYATRVVSTAPDLARLDVSLRTAESVTGEIVKNRREAVAGAEIVLQTAAGPRHARTNQDGVFTVTDLSPGPARLRVRAQGRVELVRDVEIEEREGRRPTDLGRMTLAEEGLVEGVVEDDRGRPIAGARVGRDAVPTYLPANGIPPGVAVTDAKGHFRLGGLAEGTATLEAYAPDHQRAHADGVRVISGRTTDGVKIRLARDRSSAGSVEPPASGGVAITLGEVSAGEEGMALVVRDVAENSEAERAGLLANDVLVTVGGVRPTDLADARARLSGPERDDVVVTVRRGERTVTLRIPREAVHR